MAKTYIRIHEFANIIGVHPNTIRNWDKLGKLKPEYITPTGQRIYSVEQANLVMQEKYLDSEIPTD